MKDTFKTAVCIGKQPSSDVWIFGLDIQITANRLLANPKASSILWVQEVFDMEDGGKMKNLDQDGSRRLIAHRALTFVWLLSKGCNQGTGRHGAWQHSAILTIGK